MNNFLDIENVNKITGNISEMEILLSSEYGSLLTSDDLQHITLISQMQKDSVYDFLEIAGPLYFSMEIIAELENNQAIYSKKIKLSSSLWLFGVIYEQILRMIDRRLFHYLNDTKNPLSNDKSFKSFKNQKRDLYHDHATAGEINNVLSKILALNPPNKY